MLFEEGQSVAHLLIAGETRTVHPPENTKISHSGAKWQFGGLGQVVSAESLLL